MNVLPSQIDNKYIYYNAPVKNTVMDTGRFVRVGYSDPVVNLNGVYTSVPLTVTSTERYFNKAKYSFEYTDNISTIDALTELETYVLSNLTDVDDLEPVYKLREQLMARNVRVYNSDMEPQSTDSQRRQIHLLVKISGIWLTDSGYGLTFKFFDIARPDV